MKEIVILTGRRESDNTLFAMLDSVFADCAIRVVSHVFDFSELKTKIAHVLENSPEIEEIVWTEAYFPRFFQFDGV